MPASGVIVAENADFAAPASPGITIVQVSTPGHNPNTTTSGPWTVSATLTNPPVAGNVILGVVGAYLATSATFSMAPLVWAVDAIATSTNNGRSAVLRTVSDGVTTTFTATGNSPGTTAADMWLVLIEVNGIQGPDHTAAGTNSGTATWAAALAANSNASWELAIIAVAAENATTQPTAPSYTGGLFTELATGDTGSTAADRTSLFVGSYIYESQATPSTTISWTTNSNWGGCMVSYAWMKVIAGPPVPGAQQGVNRGASY